MTKGAIVPLLACLLLIACQPAHHEIKPVLIDPGELESFADGFFPAQMEKLHIPGVSFVLVQNGQVILAKGYGYADLETGSPISAGTTVMRIGSVSKLFVATALMQLVE